MKLEGKSSVKKTPKKMSRAALARKVHEYKVAEARQQVFVQRMNAIKEELRAEAERSGQRDANGHVWMDAIETEEGAWHPHLQKRDPKQLDPTVTEEFLRKKKLWKRCSKRTITVELTPEAERVLRELGLYDEDEVQVIIDEDELYACRFEDKITEEELQELYASKITYAFYFK